MKLVQRSWSWLWHHNDPLIDIGLLITALGVVFLWRSNGNSGLLQVIGAAILGAGLTVIVSAIVGSTAAREQYRKEANLLRKREIYAPLHAEIKRLRERLESAQAKQEPYPDQIQVDTTPTDVRDQLQTPAARRITLVYWALFRSDYRIYDFTEACRNLLDSVNTIAGQYDPAIEQARLKSKEVLAPYVEQAIADELKTEKYQVWVDRPLQQSGDVPTQPLTPDDWYGLLARSPTPGQTVGEYWVNGWLLGGTYSGASYALGWLLAGNIEQAAKSIQAPYLRGSRTSEAPPLDWIKNILQSAEIELCDTDQYKTMHDVAASLLSALRSAEKHLQDAMRWIQDRYEGTPPA